ncbi:MAG: hypothetical protein KF838_14050 [Phycisphaeraceae bacterium]|nr:MAG: hypothetical protein KF838_14050 [Phycisphaeraceae bacterium]
MQAPDAAHRCRTLAALVPFALAPAAAIAQCGGWVHDLASYGSAMTREARIVELLDRDGAGPELPQLVVYTQDKQLVVRGTHDWLFLNRPDAPEVHSMWAWDPDGPGPGDPRIYLGSKHDGVSPAWYLSSVPWNRPGETTGAHTVGPVPGPVLDIISWDPDGSGQERETLIVLCKDAPYSASGSVLMWTATGWTKLGETIQLSTTVRLAVEVINATPAGTASLLLIGDATHSGIPGVRGVLVYEDGSWRQLGTGLTSGTVRDVTTWDHDADDATPRQLVACGTFTNYIGEQIRGLARFDGSTWRAIGGAVPTLYSVSATTAPGDTRESLLVAGHFTSIGGVSSNGFAAFDGIAWRSAGDIDFLPYIDSTRMWKWSPDGPLSSPQTLLAVRYATTISDVRGAGVYAWDGATWTTPVPFIDAAYSKQATWDPDGPGPQRPKLVYSSAQSYDNGLPARLALWDGVEWEIQDPGINMSIMSDIAVWDPDGDGPEKPLLVFGERMAATWGAPTVRVWAWDGESRFQLGAGFVRNTNAGSIDQLKVVDFDGDGPLPPRLIARGNFTASGTNTASSIAWFDGDQWLPLGNGLTHTSHNSLTIRDLDVMDADGDGPQGAVLLVVGTFTVVDDPEITHLAQWDGQTWSAVGGPLPPFTHHPSYVVSADPDGDGPQLMQPWIGYSERYEEICNGWSCDDYRYFTGYRWDGGIWKETVTYTWWFENSWYYTWMGPPPSRLHTVHDPDGIGPASPVLAYAGGGTTYHIGARGLPQPLELVGGPFWQVIEDGILYDDTVISSIHSYAITDDRAILSFCGDFETLVIRPYPESEARPSRGLARWMVGPPILADEPEARLNPTSRAAGLTVRAVAGGDLRYRWRRNGVPLTPGIFPWGVVHSPADPTLVLSALSPNEDGEYDCVVTNDCGSVISPIVRVPPGPVCPADFNGDTRVDDEDFFAFFNDFGQCDQLPAPCGTLGNPDVNGDTIIDILDFLDFLDAFGRGC